MPRTYRVTFEGVAVSAAQDMIQVIGAAGKTLRVLRQWVGATDTTLPTAQMLQVRGRFLPATVTNGSGGTAPTPQPLDPGDAAASFTAKANSTTPATTSATAVKLEENGFHIYSGYDVTFSRPPIVGPSESYVFELLSAAAGTVHLSGGVEVEESGG